MHQQRDNNAYNNNNINNNQLIVQVTIRMTANKAIVASGNRLDDATQPNNMNKTNKNALVE
ncbi:GH23782 [Drosophila grimshawi]|uniref:GH23782 n=1 Tax=Drosophila grimshawi TaxID=7222 RepID=B4JTD8_DROGR|nr:GH23782 [Drosophila grimshawi]